MDGDGESKNGGFDVRNFGPRRRSVGGFEDAIVMLHPERFGIRSALHQTVNILNIGIELLLRRIVLGSHSAPGLFPRLAPVARDPYASGGNADADVAGVARIDADR